MPAENAAVGVYSNPEAAEAVLQMLRASGFDSASLSVAGADGEPGEPAACCFRAGARVRYWGKSAPFWNAVCEWLPGWAVLNEPRAGAVLVAGPLADWIATGLDNAPIFSGLSALGAALYNLGMPKERVAELEAALAGGGYLVIAHGPAGEVERARSVMGSRVIEDRGKQAAYGQNPRRTRR